MLTKSGQAAKIIAGEITLSANRPESMRRWRQVFGIKQSELAKRLKFSPSVISDYESGRRMSPGTNYVKRLVETLVDIDLEKGGHVLDKFMTPQPDAILALKELTEPIEAKDFVELVDGTAIVNEELINKRRIRGYTVVDSIQAILNFSDSDFRRIYGSSSERAVVFTKVKIGRSPMIAVKVTQPKPAVMVLHGLRPENVDKLARDIALKERIPLVVSRIEKEQEIIDKLRRTLT